MLFENNERPESAGRLALFFLRYNLQILPLKIFALGAIAPFDRSKFEINLPGATNLRAV